MALRAMFRNGLARVKRRKQGNGPLARISLTPLGRQVGAILDKIDHLLAQRP